MFDVVFFQLTENAPPVPALPVKQNEDGSLDLAVFTGDHAEPVKTFKRRVEDTGGRLETYRHDFIAHEPVPTATVAPTQPAPPPGPPAPPVATVADPTKP